MKVEFKKVYEVKRCSQCPYMNTLIDASVCEDSFDEPNYLWCCGHDNIDKNTDGYRKGYGKLIDIGMSSFQTCNKIPDLCPEKLKLEQKLA